PGAVTVTTPAQDAAGNVAATLTYVDTSGKLLSKEARAGTTTIAIGKAVKQTVDTRFYPRVHVCVSNLSASGYIVPGQTEVQICDLSDAVVPNGSGYTVTLPGMSSAGCTKSGGGVCPPDTAGVKADFTGLTGDDIAQLVFRPKQYDIADTIANVTEKSSGPGGMLVYYGELASHFPYAPLGGNYGSDIFHTAEAKAFCSNAPRDVGAKYNRNTFIDGLESGTATGGAVNVSGLKSMFIGPIANTIKTGGDTNPELFVSGGGQAKFTTQTGDTYEAEFERHGHPGALLPLMLVMVNGSKSAAVSWSMTTDSIHDMYFPNEGKEYDVSLGDWLARVTQWNLSDMYFVNNWPGTPLTQHKADKDDTTNKYVTQVNYVSGYVCAAILN
ncbi:hypothetical protein ABDA80_004782, partial [Salmonella enterica]